MAELDLSGLSRGQSVLDRRLAVVEAEVEHTASCSGHLVVLAFSSSAAANVTLYDGVLRPAGATVIARTRVLPAIADGVMSTVRGRLEGALRSLPSGSTDVSAAFVLAADEVALVGRGATVDVTVLTDGITTVGPTAVNAPGLTEAQATAAADRAPHTDLRGARVVVEGVGTVAAAAQPPSDYIAAVRSYVAELCRRSQAATCLVTTEVAVR